MEIFRYPAKDAWPGLLKRPVMDNRSVDSIVLPIIQDVQKRGDEALLEYTTQFDKVTLSSLQVSVAEFDEAERLTPQELKDAIRMAVLHIEKFHKSQKTQKLKLLKVLSAGRNPWPFKKWACTYLAEVHPYSLPC
jgi:histidinol dehydrogenase